MARKRNKNVQNSQIIDNNQSIKTERTNQKSLADGVGYKIGFISGSGSVKGYLVETEDEMENKVLELMDKSFKKIVVQDRKTKERKVYLPTN